MREPGRPVSGVTERASRLPPNSDRCNLFWEHVRRSPMSSRSVAEYWDKFVGSHLNSPDHWEANQVVQQSQWRFITGSAFLNPIDWFMQRFGPFARMASICSGSGLLE